MDVFLDLLCFESVCKAFVFTRKHKISTFYYLNVSGGFSRHTGLLRRIFGVVFVPVGSVVFGDCKLNGVSLYERIQNTLTGFLDRYVHSAQVRSVIGKAVTLSGMNETKLKEHVREAAYYQFYRPAEMYVLAEKLSADNSRCFIMRKTPLFKHTAEFLGKGSVLSYTPYFFNAGFIRKRAEYYYDVPVISHYFRKTSVLRNVCGFWFKTALAVLLRFPWSRKISHDGPSGETFNTCTIGIELSQNRIRRNEINDIFWLKDSGIDMRSVRGLELTDLDEESEAILSDIGLKRYRVVSSFGFGAWLRGNANVALPYGNVRVDFGFVKKTYGVILRLLAVLLRGNENAWLTCSIATFKIKTAFWENIYAKLGIKLLWAMYDVDPDKLSKAQALENLGGLFLGSHWSNFPMSRVDNQKCCDVLLTWGEHFKTNNFSRYPFKGVFVTGYPLDYYFSELRASAAELREKYPGKFIVSYQDNIFADDLPYSANMQLSLFKMFIGLLESHEKLMLFLKPKKQHAIEVFIREVPQMEAYMRAGRILIFEGETPQIKAVPAFIGMASDLVVGLGISTTAAECFFAGTIAYHADLTGFTSNQFAQNGLGSVVFRKIEDLERSIEGRISGAISHPHNYYRTLYECLDPFQDGSAYLRIGFLIKQLYGYLKQGVSRGEAVKNTKRDYDYFLQSQAQMPGVH